VTLASRLFAAYRWGFSSRRRMSLSRALLAGAGIAAGVTALVVVLGVMGGLQQGYIDSILEISSFHMRVEVPEASAKETMESLRSVRGISSVVAFKETHVLAMGPSGQALTLSLRAFQDGAESADPSLARALGLAVSEKLPIAGTIVLGKEAAATLGADSAASIELFGMTRSDENGILPARMRLPVGSVFDSGYYEFDSSMAFVPLAGTGSFSEAFGGSELILGIKLEDRNMDYRMAGTVRSKMPEGVGPVLTWRDYNRSFFGALRTEKSIMMLLISLIFVVVGINIFHAMCRTIAAKMSDIAVLKACGASDSDIRGIFMADGLTIGLGGAAVGSALGLLLCANINLILDLAAGFMRFATSLLEIVGIASRGRDFRLFSPEYFYIEAIPVSISAAEILFIAFTAIASTVVAAGVASRRVSAAKPSEVFRHD